MEAPGSLITHVMTHHSTPPLNHESMTRDPTPTLDSRVVSRESRLTPEPQETLAWNSQVHLNFVNGTAPSDVPRQRVVRRVKGVELRV